MSKPAKFAYATLLGVFAAAVLFASPLSVPTVFNPGDPLSAAAMNGNFGAVQAAVNDNDARIATNAANITASAGSISANATAIAANGTAIAGKVSRAGDTMTGGLTVPSLTYAAPRVASVTYGATGFSPRSSSLNFDRPYANGYTEVMAPSTSGSFFHALTLPAGVTITGIRARVYDGNGAGLVGVTLSQVGGAITSVATTNADAAGWTTLTGPAISHVVAPGPDPFYHLEVFLSQAGAGILGFYSVTVDYQYTQP